MRTAVAERDTESLGGTDGDVGPGDGGPDADGGSDGGPASRFASSAESSPESTLSISNVSLPTQPVSALPCDIAGCR